MKSIHLIVAIPLFLVSSCGANNSQNETESIQIDKESFSIKSFIPILNYGSKDENPKLLNIDFNDAIQGIEIPTITQTPSGYCTFNFQIKNNSKNPSSFYSKLYYQNKTYKFSMIWGRDMVKWRTAQRTAMKDNGKTTRSKEKEQWFG